MRKEGLKYRPPSLISTSILLQMRLSSTRLLLKPPSSHCSLDMKMQEKVTLSGTQRKYSELQIWCAAFADNFTWRQRHPSEYLPQWHCNHTMAKVCFHGCREDRRHSSKHFYNIYFFGPFSRCSQYMPPLNFSRQLALLRKSMAKVRLNWSREGNLLP